MFNALFVQKRISTTLLTVALWILVLLYLFPLLWFLISSFKPATELFTYPLNFLPRDPTLANYASAIDRINLLRYFGNTAFAAMVTTLLTIIASATCGYALAKYDYKWLSVFFMCIIATTMLPTEVILVPTFQVITGLGLFNNIWGIIIPSINTATGIFMFRQFFISVPNDLIESARIDGAHEGRIFLRVMLPIAKPVIMTLAIFSLQWRWNDYIWPLLVLSNPRNFTIQIALRNIVGAETVDWALLLGASVISLIPLLLVFIAFQRYIMDSDVTSGIK